LSPANFWAGYAAESSQEICARHLFFLICEEAILIYDSDPFFCAESDQVERVFIKSK